MEVCSLAVRGGLYLRPTLTSQQYLWPPGCKKKQTTEAEQPGLEFVGCWPRILVHHTTREASRHWKSECSNHLEQTVLPIYILQLALVQRLLFYGVLSLNNNNNIIAVSRSRMPSCKPAEVSRAL